MDLFRGFVYTTCFQKWKLPFMEEEREKLVEKERILYSTVWRKMGKDHDNMFPMLSTQRNTDGMSDRAFELHESRSQESWKNYQDKSVSEEYKLNKDKFIQAYNDIIEICDKTVIIMQNLCDKNIQSNYTFNSKNLKSIYKIVKESSNSVDIETLKSDCDWIERTMPIIRILHLEYIKVLDYQRLVKLQQKANLIEEEAISIIHYLISKNLTTFYFKIGKYPENTLLVKKIMNRFSKEHDIRPEDTLEVFQEYIGNGEESKRIKDHEIVVYLD
jgi:hypothetical protein